MNITHTKMNAAAGENFCGYSLVRRIAAGCLIAAAVMTSAVAGPGEKERLGQREQYRAERAQQQQRQYEDRQRNDDARAYEQRADEQRRGMQAQQDPNAQNESFRRSGRLTPDERRDLRRQINEAGVEIYPNRQRR